MTPAPMRPASGSIQSQPKTRASMQADDDQHRNRGVGDDMDDCGAHVVVARRAMRMRVFLEHDGVMPRRTIRDVGVEGVRFGNLLDGFADSRRDRQA